MSSHSQFKRFNILQELEQAIKKKTHEKYKSKSKSKPIELKPAKTPILQKQSVNITRKPTTGIQPTLKSKCQEFKVKKYQNKKFDKVVSLINYTITSADKALKYVNLSSNFQAEFAYKLYLSDRQNLMNELNNLNLQQMIASISPLANYMQLKAPQQSQFSNMQLHSLKNENDKLKKEIMIMEGEIKKYKLREQEPKNSMSSMMIKPDPSKQEILKRQVDVKQVHVSKLSDFLKRLCNFTEVYDYLDLLDKEMKYRAVLATATLTGFELNRTQRDDLQRNLQAIDGKIGEVQGLMIGKMQKLAEGQDQEVLEELEAINKLLHRKIAPILKENQSQSLENKKISEIITMYVNYSSKREKQLVASHEKMQGKFIDYIQLAKDSEKKDSLTQQKMQQVNKQNDLLKSNLKDIYEELRGILSQNLRKNGYTESSDITFETLLKEIQLSLMRNAQLRTTEKKLKQLLEEDNRKNSTIMKQKSLIESMEKELNGMKAHVKDSQDRKRQVEEYVLILQKKKKDQDREYDDMRNKLEHFEKQLQENETLLFQKQKIIKKFEDQLAYFKQDVQKLSALVHTREAQVHQREDTIHERENELDRFAVENHALGDQVQKLKHNIEVEIDEKNKILEHLRQLQDRFKETQSHLEAVNEEASERSQQLHHEINQLSSSLKESLEQKNRFQNLYNNLLSTVQSEQTRRQSFIVNSSQEIESLRQQIQKTKDENQTLHERLNELVSESQRNKQELIEISEQEKQELLSEMNQIKSQLQEMKLQAKKTSELSHVELMQQEVSSQEDMMEEINMKEEQIIKLQRALQSVEEELEDKNRIIEQNQSVVSKLKQHQAQLQQRLSELNKQLAQRKANEEALTQQVQRLQQQVQSRTQEKSQVNSRVQEHELHNQQMEQRITQLQTELQEKNQEIEGLKTQLSSKENQFLQLQHKMQHLQSVIEEKESELFLRGTQLDESQAQLQSKLNQLQEKQILVSEKQNQLETRQEQLETKRNEVEGRFSEVESRQAHLSEMAMRQSEKTSQIKAKEEQLEKMQNEIQISQSQLQQKHAQLQQKEGELDTKLEEIQSRQNQLQAKQNQLESKLSHLQEKQSYLQEKSSQLQGKQSQLQERSIRLDNWQSEIEGKQKKFSQVSHQQEQQPQEKDNEQKQSLIEKCKELQEQLQKRTDQLIQREQQLQEKDQEIQTISQQLQQLQQALIVEKSTSTQLSQQLSSHQSTILDLQQQIQSLQSSNQALINKIKQLKQEVEQLQSEIVDLKLRIQQDETLKQEKSEQIVLNIQSNLQQDNNQNGNQQQAEEQPIEYQSLSPIQDYLPQKDQQEQQEQDEDQKFQSINVVADSQLHEPKEQPVYQGTSIDIIQTKYKKLVTELKSQVQEKQLDLTELKQSHTLLSNKNNELIYQIESLQQTKLSLQNQLQNLRDVARQRMQNNDKLNDQLSEVRKQSQMNTKKLEKEIEEYEELHVAPLRQILVQKEQELIEMVEKYQELQNTLEQTKRIKEEYIEAIEKQANIKQEELKNQLQSLRAQIDTERLNTIQKEKQIQSLIEDNQRLQQEVQQLKAQLSQNAEESTKTHDQALSSLQVQTSILKQESQLLQTKMATVQLHGQIKIRELNYQIMTLTTELQTKNDQIHYIRKEIEEKQTDQNQINLKNISQNQQEIQKLKQQLQITTQDLLIISIDFQKASQKIKLLQTNLEQVNRSSDQKESALQELRSLVSQLQDQIQSLQIQKETLNDQKHSIVSQKDSIIMQKDLQLLKKEQQVQELRHSLHQTLKQLQQRQVRTQSSGKKHLEVEEEQQEQQEQLQEQQAELQQFNDMSEQRNDSMVSNEAQTEQITRQRVEENEVHQARFQNFLAKNMTTHLHEPVNVQNAQNEQEDKESNQDYLNEFEQMKQEQINDSMVSNDATEERGDYYIRETKIIDQNYLPKDTHLSTNLVKTHQTPLQSHQTHSQQETHEQQIETQKEVHSQPKDQINAEQQDYVVQSDMKSQKISDSILSNRPETQKEIVEDQNEQYTPIHLGHNLVDAHEDRQHSQGSYEGERAIKTYIHQKEQHQQEQEQEQKESQEEKNDKELENQEEKNEEESAKKSQQNDEDIQKQQDNIIVQEQQEVDRDLCQFKDMQEQKMNDSMISYQPEPSEHQEIYQVTNQIHPHENLIDAHESKQHSEGSVDAHHYGGDQVVEQKTHFKSLDQIHVEDKEKDEKEGGQLYEFEQMKSGGMNESVMSNRPESAQQEVIIAVKSSQIEKHNLVDTLAKEKSQKDQHEEKQSEEQQNEEQGVTEVKYEDIEVEENEENEENGEQIDKEEEQNEKEAEDINNGSQEAQVKEEQQQQELSNGKQRAQFNQIVEYRMNQSSISNKPQPTQTDHIPTTSNLIPSHYNIVDANQDIEHSQSSQVHHYQIQNQSNQLDIEPDLKTDIVVEDKSLIKSSEEVKQIGGQYQQVQGQGLDEFGDMESEKINNSIISNQPQPTEHPDFIYHQVESPQKNIVTPNEQRQHSQASIQPEIPEDNSYKVDSEKDYHSEQVQQEHREEQDQKEQQTQKEQKSDQQAKFEEFSSFKQQKMNASIISNQPQPAQSEYYSHHQTNQTQHHNLVNPHEERQHSDQADTHYHQKYNAEDHLQQEEEHYKSEQVIDQYEEQKQNQEEKENQEEQQFDEFADMKSEKMNASMMSNNPEPTENQENQENSHQQLQSSPSPLQEETIMHRNLVQVQPQSHNTCRSQYQYHQSQLKQVQIHRALPTAAIPQDQNDNSNKVLQERMNESMMSNQPQASEKNQSNQQSQQQHYDKVQIPTINVFDHNLVTVSRISQSNKKQQGDIYLHDGRSQRGNMFQKEQFQDEQRDIVEISQKKNLNMIDTQHHHYRSEYQFGDRHQSDKKSENDLDQLEHVRNARKFNQSIASNEAEINDVGGDFINVYALDDGRNNKIERNMIMSHNEFQERSVRNVEMEWSQSGEKRDVYESQTHLYKHHTVRSQYSYEQHKRVGEVEASVQKELSEVSDSMKEEKDEDQYERDSQVEHEKIVVQDEDQEENQEEIVQKEQQQPYVILEDKTQSLEQAEINQEESEKDEAIIQGKSIEVQEEAKPQQLDASSSYLQEQSPIKEPIENITPNKSENKQDEVDIDQEEEENLSEKPEQESEPSHQQLYYLQQGVNHHHLSQEVFENQDQEVPSKEDRPQTEQEQPHHLSAKKEAEDKEQHSVEQKGVDISGYNEDKQDEQGQEPKEHKSQLQIEREEREKQLEEEEEVEREDEQDHYLQEDTEDKPMTSSQLQVIQNTQHQNQQIQSSIVQNVSSTPEKSIQNLEQNAAQVSVQDVRQPVSDKKQTQDINEYDNEEEKDQQKQVYNYNVDDDEMKYLKDEEDEEQKVLLQQDHNEFEDEEKEEQKQVQVQDQADQQIEKDQEELEVNDQFLQDKQVEMIAAQEQIKIPLPEPRYQSPQRLPKDQQADYFDTQKQVSQQQELHEEQIQNQQPFDSHYLTEETQVHQTQVFENCIIDSTEKSYQQTRNYELESHIVETEIHKVTEYTRTVQVTTYEVQTIQQTMVQSNTVTLQHTLVEEEYMTQSLQNYISSPIKQQQTHITEVKQEQEQQQDLEREEQELNQENEVNEVEGQQQAELYEPQITNEQEKEQTEEQEENEQEVQKAQQEELKIESNEVVEDVEPQKENQEELNEEQEESQKQATEQREQDFQTKEEVAEQQEQQEEKEQQDQQEQDEELENKSEIIAHGQEKQSLLKHCQDQQQQLSSNQDAQFDQPAEEQTHQLLQKPEHDQQKDQDEQYDQLQEEPQSNNEFQEETVQKQPIQLEQNNISDFKDIKSQSINASLISNNDQSSSYKQVQQEESQQEQTQILQTHEKEGEIISQEKDEKEDKEQEYENDFENFNDMASQKMGDSMLSNYQDQPAQQNTDKQHQIILSHQEISEPQSPAKQTQEDHVEEDKQYLEQEDNQSEGNQETQLQEDKEESKNNLSDFNDMASQNMTDSIISYQGKETSPQKQSPVKESPIKESPVKESPSKELTTEQYHESQILDDQQSPAKQEKQQDINVSSQRLEQQKSSDENNFSQFNQMQNEEMSASMLSNQQNQDEKILSPSKDQQVNVSQHEKSREIGIEEVDKSKSFDQNNFSDFNDMASEKMGDSMISNNHQNEASIIALTSPILKEPIKSDKREEDVTEAHEVDNKQNISDFNDFASQKMGDSILSATQNEGLQTQQHYQQDNFHNEQAEQQVSEIKQHQTSQQKKSSPAKQVQEQGNDFDAFNSMAEQNMDGSLFSNNDDKNLDWFVSQEVSKQQSGKNKNQQQVEQQGFSDFKDYNSQHMSQSQVSAQDSEIKTPYEIQPQSPFRLKDLQQKQEHQESEEMEKVLPIDILLTSERRRQEQIQQPEEEEQKPEQEEDENYNALLQFLPGADKKQKLSLDPNDSSQLQGKLTSRSDSYNDDDFQFRVRKSVESIDSKVDIFENFNQSGFKLNLESEFKSAEMIKSSGVKTMKGQNLFTFSQVMENQNESSYQSSSYQQNDDFDAFMTKSNQPSPSPVNKASGVDDFFDFGDKVEQDKKEEKDDDEKYFSEFE